MDIDTKPDQSQDLVEAQNFDNIAGFFEELGENPYNRETHVKLIKALRAQGEDLVDELRSARLSMLQYHFLSEEDLSNWLIDAQKASVGFERIDQVKEFYEATIPIYSSPEIWHGYLEFVLEVYCSNELNATSKETDLWFSKDDVENLMGKALYDTMYDFKESYLVWNSYYEYKLKDLNGSSLSELKSIQLERLSIPHEQLDESFSKFSAFITTHDNANYGDEMQKANQIYSNTKKYQNQVEIIELQLNKDEEDPQLWIQYIESENKRPKKSRNFQLINTIFKRSIRRNMGNLDWIPVWLSYIYILYAQNSSTQILEKVLDEFTLSYPTSAISWAEYIRNCQDYSSGFEKLRTSRERILKTEIMTTNSYDDWKTLALSILSSEFNYVKHGNVDAITELYTDCSNFSKFAIDENNDVFHAVEKLAVQIFEFLDDVDEARVILKKLTSKFKDQCENWLFVYEFEKKHGDYQSVSKLLRTAVSNTKVLDWPERIIHEWLTYEQLFGTLTTYKQALLRSNKELVEVNQRRLAEFQIQQQQQQQQLKEDQDQIQENTKPAGKRPRDDNDSKNSKKHQAEPVKRDRENLSVKVQNLPPTVTEAKLVDFFKECGEIKSVSIVQSDTESKATLEFSAEQELISALTKDKKKFDGVEIVVSRAINCTVWVTNFPPSESQESIEKLFSLIGKVVSIRFPSLKSNSNRRFCYVEYVSSQFATNAVAELDKKNLKGNDGKNYKLIVKISAPEERQQRSNPADEGREIFIRNLNFKKVDKEVLSEMFSDYGTIEKITIPLSEKNKGSGSKNDGYAFIVFTSKQDAVNALNANNKEYEGRAMNVTIAEPTNKPKAIRPKQGKDFSAEATVSVLGLPDTVSAAQIRSFLSSVGPIRKVELHTDAGGALVEFENIADAGKASIAFNMKELDGKALQIGSKTDLLKKKPMEKPKMMVPTSVGRRGAREKK